MFKNYFLLGIRNAFRHRTSSVINVLGLSTGIAAASLVLLFVISELSYDRFLPGSDRIYRLAVEAMIGDTKIHQTYSSALTFTRLMEDFPEVENGVKITTTGKTAVFIDGKTYYEDRLMIADSSFFEVFSVPLVIDHNKPLNRPATVVLAEKTAERYFGETADAVGKIIRVDFPYGIGSIEFEVTAVFRDFPYNSHFHPDILCSSGTFPDLINDQGWSSNNFITYLVLEEGSDPDEFNTKLEDFTRRNMGGDQFDEWVSKGNYWKYFLQPLVDIHLDSDLNGEFETNGNRSYVRLFLVIAIFIILIACINYMNLATARSTLRTKEIGIRKVFGAGRKRLVLQFLGESLAITFISLIAGLIIAELTLPYFRNMVGRELSFSLFNPVIVVSVILLVWIILGLLAGTYPSFFMSSFNPVRSLKGETGSGKSTALIRQVLVISQFAITVVLLIGTFTVVRQMRYFQDKELGYDKNDLLVIENPDMSASVVNVLKEELGKLPLVMNVASGEFLPGKGFSNWGFGAEGVDEAFSLNAGSVDYNYLETMNIEMESGRFFSRDYPADSSAAILNETAAKVLGWDNEEAIGKKINNWNENRGDFHVIGVVKDFHYESLHQDIRPMALFLGGGYSSEDNNFIIIRLKKENSADVVSQVRQGWEKLSDSPFEFFFMDEEYSELYVNELRTKRTFSFFALVSVFIACLGLFGLASFVADRKTREIGIRKVLGAESMQLVFLLNRNFGWWVLIANLVSWPVGWYVMDHWLRNFPYRTELEAGIFILAGGISFLIAFLIVSLQTTRAAWRNPAETLRYE